MYPVHVCLSSQTLSGWLVGNGAGLWHGSRCSHLQSLVQAGLVELGAEVGGSGAGLGEVLCEDWLEEGAEDELGAAGELLAGES